MIVGGGQDVGRHDLPDPRLLRRAAHDDDLAGVVSLGDDADELAVFVQNHKRTDRLVGHQLDRLEDRGIGRDGQQIPAFGVEQVLDQFHRFPFLADNGLLSAPARSAPRRRVRFHSSVRGQSPPSLASFAGPKIANRTLRKSFLAVSGAQSSCWTEPRTFV